MSLAGSGLLEIVHTLRTFITRLEAQSVTHPQLAQNLLRHLNEVIRPFVAAQLGAFEEHLRAELEALRDTIQVSSSSSISSPDISLSVGQDLVLTGVTLQPTTTGFSEGYLRIKINDKYYKLALLND